MGMENYFKSENSTLSKDGSRYYKNDVELKVEDITDNYDDKQFDKEIKLAVSGWVNNRFDNIVCLINAGASVVIRINFSNREVQYKLVQRFYL